MGTTAAKPFLLGALGVLASFPAASQELRYDREYPAVGYSTARRADPVARLWEELRDGRVQLAADSALGLLPALLDALQIPPSSQLLVFSKTSLQERFISPSTPRALYFTDDVYIAWVPGSGILEIAAVDPVLGPVFYTLEQGPGASDRPSRAPGTPPLLQGRTVLCLECHDTFSLTGGGVPRLILGSGVTDSRGRPATHEAWRLTSPTTPFRDRWGGWYVTGTHGDLVHLGNAVHGEPGNRSALDRTRTGNLTDLGGLLDLRPYPGAHSDIVAHLVVEHQVHVQNVMTRASWETRQALAESGSRGAAEPPKVAGGVVTGVLERFGEDLVRALLMVEEAPLRGPVRGTSGFTADFQARGPRDRFGRSLRDLELERRVFRYPLSYLVYSPAFDSLPDPLRAHVARRLEQILEEGDTAFPHLSPPDRSSILEILRDTKPGFLTTR